MELALTPPWEPAYSHHLRPPPLLAGSSTGAPTSLPPSPLSSTAGGLPQSFGMTPIVSQPGAGTATKEAQRSEPSSIRRQRNASLAATSPPSCSRLVPSTSYARRSAVRSSWPTSPPAEEKLHPRPTPGQSSFGNPFQTCAPPTSF